MAINKYVEDSRFVLNCITENITIFIYDGLNMARKGYVSFTLLDVTDLHNDFYFSTPFYVFIYMYLSPKLIS